MSNIQAAILGLVQGLAEFLPISSSGHLNLLQELFGLQLENQLLLNILLHFGTLFAVLIAFWRDWIRMIAHPIKNKTLLLLFVASLPALAAKVLFGDTLDLLETSNRYLGAFFLLTGLFLLLTQAIGNRNELKKNEKNGISLGTAITMGCFQAIGMLPGVSRSGSTIFGGVCTKAKRQNAAKFSFMMSAPAILASTLVETKHAIEQVRTQMPDAKLLECMKTLAGGDLIPIAIGMVVAFICGYLSIRFFMKVVGKASLNWFALYVILLGIFVILLQILGILSSEPLSAGSESIAAFVSHQSFTAIL